MTREEFAAAAGVSRETLGRLAIHADLLNRWQPKINLVGGDSLADLWERHFLDSAQLFPLAERTHGAVYDLGSGAGFPGLVLAIMGIAPVTLVESDQRKAVFLREVIRMTGVPATVRATRIEDLRLQPPALLTARALAPMPRLLRLVERLIGPMTRVILLKGQDVEVELTEARKYWNMHVDLLPSRTAGNGRVVVLEGIERVRPNS